MLVPGPICKTRREEEKMLRETPAAQVAPPLCFQEWSTRLALKATESLTGLLNRNFCSCTTTKGKNVQHKTDMNKRHVDKADNTKLKALLKRKERGYVMH